MDNRVTNPPVIQRGVLTSLLDAENGGGGQESPVERNAKHENTHRAEG
jgi:hypothetical protein